MEHTNKRLPDDSVVSELWSKYEQLRRHLSFKIPLSIARQADADDVLQDAFAEVCQNTELLENKEDSAAVRWLAVVAKRKLIDRIRRSNARKRKGTDAVDVPSLNIPDQISTPSSFAARHEAKEILAIAFSQLSDRYQTAIQLRFYQDLPYAELSEQLGISEGAAQMLVSRAVRRLKELLGHSSHILST